MIEMTAIPPISLQNYRIAAIIPCYNEELTIAKVVSQFQTFLPEAAIYVYNNRSTDDTVTEALKAGALVPGANP
jgi:glycosyltransferase involved in cell wall biosynthesis